jgi:hypothetical protein
MVDITRERFDAAVGQALAIAVHHGQKSLQGDSPRFFKDISITPREKEIITDAYRDVIELSNTSARRKKYEKLLLDYLAKTTALTNRAEFESGRADVLQLPDIKEQSKTTDVFFCGPFGMGDYDFYQQMKNVVSSTLSSERPDMKSLFQVFSQGAAVSSTELAQEVLRENLSAEEKQKIAALSPEVVSTYFRADQSAIANAVPLLFQGLNVNRVHTERFVSSDVWNKPGAIAERIKGDGASTAIVVATLPKSEHALSVAALNKDLPLAQVEASARDFEKNLPQLAAAADQTIVYRYDGKDYAREPNWRGNTATRRSKSR